MAQSAAVQHFSHKFDKSVAKPPIFTAKIPAQTVAAAGSGNSAVRAISELEGISERATKRGSRRSPLAAGAYRPIS